MTQNLTNGYKNY